MPSYNNEHNISMRIIYVRNEIILAACDKELLGKRFVKDNIHLEVKKEFYHEVFVNRETFVNALKIATIANLVGKRVVEIAIEEGFVDKENVLWIGDVPHAQIVKLL